MDYLTYHQRLEYILELVQKGRLLSLMSDVMEKNIKLSKGLVTGLTGINDENTTMTLNKFR